MDDINVRRIESSPYYLVTSFLLSAFTLAAIHGWGQHIPSAPGSTSVAGTRPNEITEVKVLSAPHPADPSANTAAHPLNSKSAEETQPNGTTAPSPVSAVVDPRRHMSEIPGTGAFITCVKTDADGAIWIGAEEFGLARLFGDTLTLFAVDNGLTDSSPFTMEPDHQGGLWVGNRTKGVSHFDGRIWTHYGLPDGLGGVRVYDIAVSRSGNEVWCASENGVSTFNGHTWRNFSLNDGLPAGEISAVSVSPSGDIWVAGANGGLACRKGDSWVQRDPDSCLQEALINDVHFTADGTCWVATQDGIYVRPGSENAELPPECERIGEWSRLMPHTFLEKSVTENVITCIAEGSDGSLHFGTRRYGLFSYHPASHKWSNQNSKTHQLPDNYVQSIAVAPDGNLVVGLYGYGVRTESEVPETLKVTRPAPMESSSCSASPTPEWSSMLKTIPPPQTASAPKRLITCLGEDWETQGNWIGNYGATAYILPAMGAPHDFRWTMDPGTISYRAYMGPKHKDGDSLRYWVHARRTKDRRALQNPIEPTRRQSSWDDAGELYPPDYGGPDLFVDIDLPPGHHVLSLYFVNFDCLECPASWRTSDGLPLPNRFRDYVVRISPKVKGNGTEPNDPSPESPSRSDLPVVQVRVRSFNTGVYKRFCISGPGSYTIQIARETSHNTVLSGIFVDPLPPVPDLEIPAPSRNETADGHDMAGVVNTLLGSLCERRASEPERFPIAMRIASINLLHCLKPQISNQLKAKTVPPPELMECQSVLAQMLSAAGMPDSAACSYTSLGELWDRNVTVSGPDARAQAIENCNRSLTVLTKSQWKSHFGAFCQSGWQPLERVLIAADIYFGGLAENSPEVLRRYAVACSKDRPLFSLAGLAWRKLSEVLPNDSLSPEELDAKARYLLKEGKYQDAVTLFRELADTASGDAEKSNALEMLVYTAKGFTGEHDVAEKAEKELAQLMAHEPDKRQFLLQKGGRK